jgi:hypothetical protein
MRLSVGLGFLLSGLTAFVGCATDATRATDASDAVPRSSCQALRSEWLSLIESPALRVCEADADCFHVSWAYSCDIRRSIPISGDCGRVANSRIYANSRAAQLEGQFDSAGCGGMAGICDCNPGFPRCEKQQCIYESRLPDAGRFGDGP